MQAYIKEEIKPEAIPQPADLPQKSRWFFARK